MKRIFALVIAALFAVSGSAFAASHAGAKMDDKKDGMAKDGMKKDGMAKDGMKKDDMAKKGAKKKRHTKSAMKNTEMKK